MMDEFDGGEIVLNSMDIVVDNFENIQANIVTNISKNVEHHCFIGVTRW